MTGIGIAVATGAPTSGSPAPDPDPAPLSASLSWNGPVPLNVSGASGSTGGFPNVFTPSVSGGTSPYSRSVSVTANPSGKLSAVDGGSISVSWSGLAVTEQQYISVQVTYTDAAGASSSASDTAIIKRTS